MDIERPDLAQQQRRKRIRYTIIATIGVALAAFGISQLKPALPTIERGNAWIDQVKRGTLVRQVRGSGTLVPIEVNWISAATDARVERIEQSLDQPIGLAIRLDDANAFVYA